MQKNVLAGNQARNLHIGCEDTDGEAFHVKHKTMPLPGLYPSLAAKQNRRNSYAINVHRGRVLSNPR